MTLTSFPQQQSLNPTSAKTVIAAGMITFALTAVGAEPELLVLLSDTGRIRNGLPVLEAVDGHRSESDILERGLSGVLLRVYRMQQYRLARKTDVPAEPAYLLLSESQGGYARIGFFLGDQDKSHAGYVDLHRDMPPAGKFGAMDQIFPHELFHVIRLQLAGPLGDGDGDGYANQIHAIGLRTDPVTAFNEGFAEALQALAIDHPDAEPSTARLAADQQRQAAVEMHLARYRKELLARISLIPPMRIGFLAWYANDEDVLRYFGVKENRFSRLPFIPNRLLNIDPYRAYLLEGIVPGTPADPPASLARMAATEGVVAHLLYNWLQSEALRQRYRGTEFYSRFGPGQPTPEENLYLKMIEVLLTHKPQDIFDMVESYRTSFPEDIAAVDELLTRTFGKFPFKRPPQLTLANPEFSTGTTLFDQFRGLPREHTFDLNAASLVDLVAIPGVSVDLAKDILAGAPYARLEALPDMPEEVKVRLQQMWSEMARLRKEAKQESAEDVIDISAILMPYAWRIGLTVFCCAVLAAFLYGALIRSRESRPSRLRIGINGLTATVVGVGAGWAAGTAGSIVAVGLVFGLPAGVAAFARRREALPAGRVILAWLVSAIPAALAVTPLL